MTEIDHTPDEGLADMEPEPRRGSQTRKADATIYISSELKARLKKHAQSIKITMSDTTEHVLTKYLDLYENEGVDIIDPDWMDKQRTYTEKVNAEVNRYAFLNDPDLCRAFRFVDDWYVCVWDHKDNTPPLSKKIAKTEEGARNFCLGCTKTREIREGIADYESKIRSMKETVKQGVILKVPSCIEGGAVSEDLKKLYCRRTTRWMKVSKCKTLKNGMANCDALRWATVTVKGELPDALK